MTQTKSTVLEQQKLYYYRNRNNILNQKKRFRQSNPAVRLLNGAKRRAKLKGLHFDISVSDLLPMPTVCPVLGITLRLCGGGNNRAPDLPTIDRIDNSKGYVTGNVMIISYRANQLKSDASLDELKRITRFYEELE